MHDTRGKSGTHHTRRPSPTHRFAPVPPFGPCDAGRLASLWCVLADDRRASRVEADASTVSRVRDLLFVQAYQTAVRRSRRSAGGKKRGPSQVASPRLACPGGLDMGSYGRTWWCGATGSGQRGCLLVRSGEWRETRARGGAYLGSGIADARNWKRGVSVMSPTLSLTTVIS